MGNKAAMTNKTPGLAVQLLTAGSAACVADLITFPLDTAKVRLQVSIKYQTTYYNKKVITTVEKFPNKIYQQSCILSQTLKVQGECLNNACSVTGGPKNSAGVYGTMRGIITTEGPK